MQRDGTDFVTWKVNLILYQWSEFLAESLVLGIFFLVLPF